jgi:hypothetical protein
MKAQIAVAAVALSALLSLALAGEGGAMTNIPPALPEGEGLAARYPGDRGIPEAPSVVFAEDFETAPLGIIPAGFRKGDEKRWDNSYGPCLVTENPESLHSGRRGLEFTLRYDPSRNGGGMAVNKFLGEGYDTLFLRYYAKFGADTELYHGGAHNGASIAARAPGVPQTCPGLRADGSNKITVVLDTWRPRTEVPSPGDLVTYVYHMDQGSRWGDQFFPSGRVNPPGRELFGEHFVPHEDFIPDRGRWYCYELMVQTNTPGLRDGRVAFWVDGQLRADFPNLRFRTVDTLKLNRFDLGFGTENRRVRSDITMCYDDVVLATSYVGPQVAVE